MKNVPQAILDLLQSGDDFLFAHFYTITLFNGAQDFFTDLDMDIIYNAVTYKANSLIIDGMKMKLAVGLSVDEQEVRFMAKPGDTLTGADFYPAVLNGLLAGAYLKRARAFWRLGRSPWWDVMQAPVGVVDMSIMRVSTISPLGRSQVTIKFKAPTVLLDTDMPRRVYSASCQWTLFDNFVDPDTNLAGGCGMLKANFGVNYVVASTTASNKILPTGGITVGYNDGAQVSSASISQPAGFSADGLPTFQQGRLLFTSGALRNLQVGIANNDGTTFTLMYPMTTMPAPGDTFTAYAGCAHTELTCAKKFGPPSGTRPSPDGGNSENFAGFEFVPQVSSGL